MSALNIVALIIAVVGALNWGLVGIADINLVSAIFGVESALTNIIYILVGVAGIYCLVLIKPLWENGRSTAASSSSTSA